MIEIKDMGKGELVVDFVPGEGVVVEVEPLEHNIEQFGQFYKFDSSLGSDLFVAEGAFVEVVFIQNFWLDVPLQTQLDRAVVDLFVDVFNDQDQVLKDLFS